MQSGDQILEPNDLNYKAEILLPNQWKINKTSVGGKIPQFREAMAPVAFLASPAGVIKTPHADKVSTAYSVKNVSIQKHKFLKVIQSV